jgi:hypothetical protein
VSEYERGILRDIEKQSYHSGGQTICFLNSVYQKNESMEPSSKRICLEKNAESTNTGYVKETSIILLVELIYRCLMDQKYG